MASSGRIRRVRVVVGSGWSALKRLWFRALRFGFVVAAVMLGLSAIGHIAADRFPSLAGLSYLPLFPIALGAVVVAALVRAPRAARVAVALGGVLGVAVALSSMIGWQRPRLIESEAGDTVRLLQWNVLGGGYRRFLHWEISEDTIVSEQPDILVLSEAPRDRPLSRLLARLGDAWSSVQVENGRQGPYWYKLVLASRWPVRMVREQAVTDGYVMLVQVEVPGQPLRVLVVDGVSNPLRDRTGMLADVAAIARAEALAGTPVDVLAGDFNAPSRSIGFHPIWDEGYQLASASSGGWRATYPAFLPLLDIDHVLVRAPLEFDCSFFTSRGSDHRGQLVRLRVDHAQAAGAAGSRPPS